LIPASNYEKEFAMRTISIAAPTFAAALCAAFLPSIALAQSAGPRFWSGDLFLDNRVEPNIVYAVVNNTELKLDIYRPYTDKPTPVLMFLHGGGWVWENKEEHNLVILPYLELGLAVVNVEYRLGQNTLAPAAVEDCRCALHWIVRNADKYHFDRDRIVVAGRSAGGHLALMTGLVPVSAGFDTEVESDTPMTWVGIDKSTPRVAAIINWYGITDVADLLSGPNARDYAIAWIGRARDREQLAREVSPLTYVRAGVPPVLTIHGDEDPCVPYSHAVRLHQALAKAGVAEQLLTIHGGSHGTFTREQYLNAFAVIHGFLCKQHVLNDGFEQTSVMRPAKPTAKSGLPKGKS
jgi:acetyl esterase/lipase